MQKSKMLRMRVKRKREKKKNAFAKCPKRKAGVKNGNYDPLGYHRSAIAYSFSSKLLFLSLKKLYFLPLVFYVSQEFSVHASNAEKCSCALEAGILDRILEPICRTCSGI
ncbi:hypothetical protein TNCV_2794141 [Trichonephila clavipes]|nr:hypothetical protein TNCV_2794141 [Trichonephila clavipes]